MSRIRVVGSRDRGFTLMELMVVVAIIAIVAAAVVPSFSITLHKNRQREAAMFIVEAVFTARSRAARTGRCHRVTVNLDDPGVAGAGNTGGSVQVDEAVSDNDCSQAINTNSWNRLSFKSVAGDATHVGLVGSDVAIQGVVYGPPDSTCKISAGAGSTDQIFFEPTGGMYVGPSAPNAGIERRYLVQMSGSDGKAVGVNRYVRVTAGGSVRYALCR